MRALCRAHRDDRRRMARTGARDIVARTTTTSRGANIVASLPSMLLGRAVIVARNLFQLVCVTVDVEVMPGGLVQCGR